MIKLHETITAKNKQELLDTIAKAKEILDNEFEVNIPIKIINNNHEGTAVINGKVVEEIWIKTEDRTLNQILDTLAHEYSHIKYPDLHIEGREDDKQDNWEHDQLTVRMHKKVKSGLGYRMWGC